MTTDISGLVKEAGEAVREIHGIIIDLQKDRSSPLMVALLQSDASLIERLAAALPGDERAWLVELNTRTPTYWSLTLPDEPDWSSDSLKALRFSRREDAQAYIDDIGWTEAKPVEHMWMSPPPPTTEPKV